MRGRNNLAFSPPPTGREPAQLARASRVPRPRPRNTRGVGERVGKSAEFLVLALIGPPRQRVVFLGLVVAVVACIRARAAGVGVGERELPLGRQKGGLRVLRQQPLALAGEALRGAWDTCTADRLCASRCEVRS
jgi:hypothetical protein